MPGREILVTGATGRIGGRVVRELVARGLKPRALLRNPVRARELPAGVQPIVGDLEQPASLRKAVDGVEALLVVSPVHPRQCELQGNLVRAAADAGRPLVVKLSGLHTAQGSPVDSGRWHARTEQEVRELGLPFTFLRPYFFMQNLAVQLPGARSQGVIRASVGDARIAMIDAADIAAVAARLLTGEADARGQALDLTGPEALTWSEVAARIGRALGREVRCERLDADASRALFEGVGMPAWHVEILLQFERAFAAGHGATRSDAVLRVLGRPPRSLDDYLAEALSGDTA